MNAWRCNNSLSAGPRLTMLTPGAPQTPLATTCCKLRPLAVQMISLGFNFFPVNLGWQCFQDPWQEAIIATPTCITFFPFSNRFPHLPFFLNTDALNSVFWLNSQASDPDSSWLLRAPLSAYLNFCSPPPSPFSCIFCASWVPIRARVAHVPPQFASLSKDLLTRTYFYMVQNTGF